MKDINKKLLVSLLETPSPSGREYGVEKLVEGYCLAKGYEVEHAKGGLLITKGKPPEGENYPCFAAHLDTVFDDRPFRVEEFVNSKCEPVFQGRKNGFRCGIGADDKAGVYACLHLLDELPFCKAALFEREEIGFLGATEITTHRLSWFEDVAFVIEYDSPCSNRHTYTCSGKRINSDKTFIEAKDLLEENGVTVHSNDPYTDVLALASAGIECFNLPIGYRDWHTDRETLNLTELAKGIELGKKLFEKLGLETKRRFNR